MYEIKKQLSNSDIAEDGFISLKSIVNLLQDAEGLDIYYSKELKKYLKDNKSGIFLTFRQIDIYKKAGFSDIIKSVSYPTSTNRRFGLRNTLLYNEDNEVIVASNSIGPFVRLNDEKLISIPKEIVESLNHELPFEMEYLNRKIIISEDVVEKKLDKILITHNLIDRYNHLNNSYYLAIAHSLIPSDYLFNQIRAEYKKAIKEGEYFYPSIYFQDDKVIVNLKDKNSNSYAVIEFGSMW